MADSIKEKIIAAIQTKLGTITSGFYTNTFSTVHRTAPIIQPPAISIWPRFFVVDEEIYGDSFALPVRILAMQSVSKAENPDQVGVSVEADLYECLFGEASRLAYTGGDATSPDDMIGVEILKGPWSGTIESYTLTSGRWETANAAGVITVRRTSGTYVATALPMTIAGVGSFIGGALTKVDYEADIFSPVTIYGLDYNGSGIDQYPVSDDTAVTVAMDIVVRYKHKAGNPYAQ